MKEAELRRKFARLDFEKYMGVEASSEILEELDLERLILSGEATGSYSVDVELPELDLPDEDSAEIEDEVPAASSGPSLTVTKAHIGVEPSPEETPTEVPDEPADLEIEMVMSKIPEVDFHEYASPEKLGDGEASQRLLEFDDRVSMAERKLKLDETKLEGTRRLFEKDFVNRNQLESEEMQVENSRLSAKSARTSRNLFLQYEFPKESQQRLSDYEDALRRYVRRDIETRRHIIGIGTDLIWKRKSVDHMMDKLNEIADQMERTIVTAEREGLVVYGGVDKEQWGGDKIKEGASVRQWQTILTIPDMTTMIVLVKIHEADISSIELGQRADIVFDSEPDKPLTGVVDKVSVLANSQEAAMNPDLKVYDVTVRIDGTHEWVMPSMSAETEIQVNALSDVVYIPILAIQSKGAERFCYVANGGSKAERRVVETGEFNDRFIVVASGLEEGERVLLNPPVDKTDDFEEPDANQNGENSDPGLVKTPSLSEDS
jgi:multidrug resistance efflux pump